MKSQGLGPVVGLDVALGGTALLVSPASRLLGRPDAIVTEVLEQAVLWLLLGMILAIVLFLERKLLASLWLQPFRWQSLAWGLLLAAAMIYLVFPFRVWLIRVSGLPDFQVGLERVLALPIWFRVAAVFTAGLVEETLFRGYALTRLGALMGSYWLAAVVLVPAFALAHLPNWGPGFVLSLVPVRCAERGLLHWEARPAGNGRRAHRCRRDGPYLRAPSVEVGKRCFITVNRPMRVPASIPTSSALLKDGLCDSRTYPSDAASQLRRPVKMWKIGAQLRHRRSCRASCTIPDLQKVSGRRTSAVAMTSRKRGVYYVSRSRSYGTRAPGGVLPLVPQR